MSGLILRRAAGAGSRCWSSTTWRRATSGPSSRAAVALAPFAWARRGAKAPRR